MQQSEKKVMLTIFWDMKGPTIIDFLEKGGTVNSDSHHQLLKQNQLYLLNDPGKNKDVNVDQFRAL